jgi:hypothetical protein
MQKKNITHVKTSYRQWLPWIILILTGKIHKPSCLYLFLHISVDNFKMFVLHIILFLEKNTTLTCTCCLLVTFLRNAGDIYTCWLLIYFTIYEHFACKVTNNVHNLSSYIHVQRKKTSGILSQHCVYIVYIANEGCHIRMLIFFLYIFLNKDGTWKVYKVSVTCQPVYS